MYLSPYTTTQLVLIYWTLFSKVKMALNVLLVFVLVSKPFSIFFPLTAVFPPKRPVCFRTTPLPLHFPRNYRQDNNSSNRLWPSPHTLPHHLRDTSIRSPVNNRSFSRGTIRGSHLACRSDRYAEIHL